MHWDRENISNQRSIDSIASSFSVHYLKYCGRTGKVVRSVCLCYVHFDCCAYLKSPNTGRHCEILWYHCWIQWDRLSRCCSCYSCSFWYLHCWACSYLVVNSISKMEHRPPILIHFQSLCWPFFKFLPVKIGMRSCITASNHKVATKREWSILCTYQFLIPIL